MRNLQTGLAALLVAIGLLAGVPGASIAQKRQRDVITREEIMSSAHSELDLYQVIRNLRPHFLQPRPGVRSMGNANSAAVAVYVDRKRDFGIEALRSIRPDLVEEVRYFDPAKAESEFGFSAGGGAVMVKMYKAPRLPKDSDSVNAVSR